MARKYLPRSVLVVVHNKYWLTCCIQWLNLLKLNVMHVLEKHCPCPRVQTTSFQAKNTAMIVKIKK